MQVVPCPLEGEIKQFVTTIRHVFSRIIRSVDWHLATAPTVLTVPPIRPSRVILRCGQQRYLHRGSLTSATIASNVGAYSIVPSAAGANLADYTVTVQNGTLNITQAGTTTSLNVSSGSITPGESATLTAQVASSTTGTPTGSVNFYDGATLLNIDTCGACRGHGVICHHNALRGNYTPLDSGLQRRCQLHRQQLLLRPPRSSSRRFDFSLNSGADRPEHKYGQGRQPIRSFVTPLYGAYAVVVTSSRSSPSPEPQAHSLTHPFRPTVVQRQ